MVVARCIISRSSGSRLKLLCSTAVFYRQMRRPDGYGRGHCSGRGYCPGGGYCHLPTGLLRSAAGESHTVDRRAPGACCGADDSSSPVEPERMGQRRGRCSHEHDAFCLPHATTNVGRNVFSRPRLPSVIIVVLLCPGLSLPRGPSSSPLLFPSSFLLWCTISGVVACTRYPSVLPSHANPLPLVLPCQLAAHALLMAPSVFP